MKSIRASAIVRALGRMAIVAGLGVLAAAPVQAAEVRHLRIEIDETFVNEFLTDECGTLVVQSVEASLNVTLRYSKQGLLVAEIAPAGGGTIVVAAPETGESFSYPFNTTIIDYGPGATVGSAVTLRIAGLIGHVPGYIESDAGTVVLAGTVTGFDSNGTPILEFTEVISEHGHRAAPERVVAAMCAALGA